MDKSETQTGCSGEWRPSRAELDLCIVRRWGVPGHGQIDWLKTRERILKLLEDQKVTWVNPSEEERLFEDFRNRLGTRAFNTLSHCDVHSFDALRAAFPGALLATHGCGVVTLLEIRDVAKARGVLLEFGEADKAACEVESAFCNMTTK